MWCRSRASEAWARCQWAQFTDETLPRRGRLHRNVAFIARPLASSAVQFITVHVIGVASREISPSGAFHGLNGRGR